MVQLTVVHFTRKLVVLALIAGLFGTGLIYQAVFKQDSAPPFKPTSPLTEAEKNSMLAIGKKYINKGKYRRKVLEESLVNPHNWYSQKRLEHYEAQPLPESKDAPKGKRKRTASWSKRKIYNWKSYPVRFGEDTKAVGDLRREKFYERGSLHWPSSFIEMGQRVFREYTAGSERKVVHKTYSWLIQRPDVARKVGLVSDKDGYVVGVRKVIEADGTVRYGRTCALCHSTVDEEKNRLDGIPNTSLDIGLLLKLRNDFDPKVSRHLSPGKGTLEERILWGPGRMEVTADYVFNPVSTPVLRGIRYNRYLHWSGGVEQVNIAALAIRIETLMMLWGAKKKRKSRPSRELVFALAMYMSSLDPLTVPNTEHRGGLAAFAKAKCDTCHHLPNYSGSDLSTADVVGTKAAASEAIARGTGAYRVPALTDLDRTAPFLHDGSLATLEDLLGSKRLEPDFVATGTPAAADEPGVGVMGHELGLDLSPEEKRNLIAFLLGKKES
jgi:hypothetical protein